MNDYQQILRGMIQTGKVELSSVRVRPFCVARQKGTTEKDVENAKWSKQFLEFVLAQDEDSHNLPWGECFCFRGYLYPIPKGMDHCQVSAEIDSWTEDDVKRIFNE